MKQVHNFLISVENIIYITLFTTNDDCTKNSMCYDADMESNHKNGIRNFKGRNSMEIFTPLRLIEDMLTKYLLQRKITKQMISIVNKSYRFVITLILLVKIAMVLPFPWRWTSILEGTRFTIRLIPACAKRLNTNFICPVLTLCSTCKHVARLAHEKTSWIFVLN